MTATGIDLLVLFVAIAAVGVQKYPMLSREIVEILGANREEEREESGARR